VTSAQDPLEEVAAPDEGSSRHQDDELIAPVDGPPRLPSGSWTAGLGLPTRGRPYVSFSGVDSSTPKKTKTKSSPKRRALLNSSRSRTSKQTWSKTPVRRSTLVSPAERLSSVDAGFDLTEPRRVSSATPGGWRFPRKHPYGTNPVEGGYSAADESNLPHKPG
jgi:hypothetical protein